MLIETNILSLIINSFILLYFFYILFYLDDPASKIKCFMAFLLLSFISVIVYILLKDSLCTLILFYLMTLGIFYYLKHDHLLEYIFMIIYFVFLKVLSYVIVTWLMNLISYEVIFPLSYTIYLSDVFLLLFSLSTAKLFKNYLIKIRRYTIFYIAIHIILVLIYLSYLMTIFYKGELPIETSIEIILITCLVFLIYKMVNKVITMDEENMHIKLYNEELKFQQKNYQHIEDNINEIKSIKHDMNHFLLTLLDYCRHANYHKVDELLVKQLHDIGHYNMINTGNDSLDLILSSYVSKFKKENIEFITNAYDDTINIDKIDFYILLGNLLDNAVENCTSRSIKKILLDIYTEQDMIIINMKNTCLSNPLLDNPQLHTTKEDASYHGYGINSIESIVKKYQGSITYDYSYHYFMVNIKLCHISMDV